MKYIKVIGKKSRKINTKIVIRALGAERMRTVIDTKQNPFSLFALRQFIKNVILKEK